MDNILLITRNFPPTKGGIETVADYLCKHQSYLENKKLIVLHFGQIKRGVEKRFIYHHFPSWSILSTYFFSGLLVPFYVLKYKPKIIINFQINTYLGTWLSRIFNKSKTVIVHFGLELLPWKLKIYNQIRKSMLNSADAHISISNYTNSLLDNFGVSPNKRQVLPLGADPEIFYPDKKNKQITFGDSINEKDFVCLSVGRLVPRKGFDQCIRSIKLLKDQKINIHYFIGGTGPDFARLNKITEELELVSQVHFLGMIPQEKLREYYSSADLFLQPSRFIPESNEVEGFGLVYLEAAACKTPSIASKSGGIPDAILDGKTGLLIEGEDPKELSEKIKLLASDKGLLNKLGNNAHERVINELNWEMVCKNYYRHILT